jgi:asparagine synthase (glutamine-hydrolysing)
MCGIFGVYLSAREKDVELATLQAMGESIRHRGPDDDGFFRDGCFGFGMRRLSIIDLKTGHQPIHNEDGSLQIVFNGEIYNYRELVASLLERGHTLYTTSDTEAIVHLYEEYGARCVEHLRGMFGFALWDRRTRTLLLARDRLGIKPLYYREGPGGVIFASELKAILEHPDGRADISPAGLTAYLRYGYVPDPLTILEGVRKLPPGHVAVVRDGCVVEARAYWDPAPFFESEATPRSEAALCEDLRGRLADAVRSHLVSDVPIGAFLSGGVDSSAVVALMGRELGGAVKTFSIGFEEQDFDELPYARLAARRLGTEHHELVVRPESVALVDTIVAHLDEPFADASAIPTYVVSKLAREHVKVVLSGDGGDELFAGYDRYVVDHQRRGYDLLGRVGLAGIVRGISRALPESARGKNYLFNISLPRAARYLDSVSHFPPHRQRQLLAADFLAADDGTDPFAAHLARAGALGFPARLQYLDVKTYLPGDILTKVDRMSMAHSLEARVPLLDHELVEFAARIPARYQLRGRATKYAFKRAVAPLLPPEILTRKKQGFAVPLQFWFRERLDGYLREVLLDADSLRHGYFDRAYVEDLLRRFADTGKPERLTRLWALLVFAIWYRGYSRRRWR